MNMSASTAAARKKDGLTALTAWMDKEEQSIFVMPLYNGNLPSAFYRLLERMSPKASR